MALGVNATASECNSACSTGFNHPMLVGFGTRINTVTSCYCYFSGGAEPSIIPPKEFRYQKYVHPGNGPIMNTQQVADFNCFVYAQVSKQQYFSFQPIVRSYCINELFLSFIRALALLQLREQLMRLSLPPLLEAPRRLPPL